MSPDKVAVTEECVALSLRGAITFPEVVARLHAIGVERYHADYSRGESTYYLAGGDSHVVPMEQPRHAIAEAFSAAGVEAAVRQSQRGEIVYGEFLEKSMAAGCVGYFVQIRGRRVLYFGRGGEVHVELFPGAT